ncbi:stage III sporulation protein SpoIIIAB [Texcoconibacillus texcoconensis]|uniref:Stage III sporulation protein AB n=1 Tax=Texcoconibacillus texcoconensis TaxID=1095777 RepID=A0A840QNY3_9BACI|nr:stage III sporulation protein SpoIIIAB [Texcoconibacillus texcoconensis]MBB5173082.1 stage III sporulation protein AB [Texcoconibacillus texcoconensis]
MKLLGAIFIICASTGIGFALARNLKERTKQLRDMKQAITSLEAEMVYTMTPLAEACHRVSQQVPSPVSTFFSTFSDALQKGESSAYQAWTKSLASLKAHSCLQQSDLDVILQFGASLGQQDLEQQQKQVKLTLSNIDRQELEASEKQKRSENMYKSLGFLGGLLMTIILI